MDASAARVERKRIHLERVGTDRYLVRRRGRPVGVFYRNAASGWWYARAFADGYDHFGPLPSLMAAARYAVGPRVRS